MIEEEKKERKVDKLERSQHAIFDETTISIFLQVN